MELQTIDKPLDIAFKDQDGDTIEAHLNLMKMNYANLVISDNKSYESTKKARTELVTFRTSLDKAGKELKKPLQEKVKAINAFVKKWTDAAAPLENQLQDTVRAWEDKKQREKEEKERIERERVEGIRDLIARFELTALNARVHFSVKALEEAISTFESVEITEEMYQEFQAEAMVARDDAVTTLKAVLKDKLARIAEEKRLEEERQKLAAERADIERQKQELKNKLAAQKEKQELDDRRVERAKQIQEAVQVAVQKPRQEGKTQEQAETINDFHVDQACINKWLSMIRNFVNQDSGNLKTEEGKALLEQYKKAFLNIIDNKEVNAA